MTILEREMQKNPAAFAQMDTSDIAHVVQGLGAIVDAAAFSSADQERLTALVQSQEDDEAVNAPAAAAYKTQSGGILDTLADMNEKASPRPYDIGTFY